MGKSGKNAVFYVTMLVIFGLLMYLIIIRGEAQQIDSAVATSAHVPSNLLEGFGVFND